MLSSRSAAGIVSRPPSSPCPGRAERLASSDVIFTTELESALFIGWAVPVDELPELPSPLRHDVRGAPGGEVGFVTLVLFRQRGLHAAALPWARLSYPQANLWLCALDADAVASAFLLRELVPAWVVPLARFGGGQPAAAGLLEFPPAGAEVGGGRHRWSVTGGTRLALVAGPGAPLAGEPPLGDLERTVAFWRDRGRAYARSGGRLRRLATLRSRADAVPAVVELECADWLRAQLPEVSRQRWPRPHSAFILPSVRLVVESERERRPALATHVPAPG